MGVVFGFLFLVCFGFLAKSRKTHRALRGILLHPCSAFDNAASNE